MGLYQYPVALSYESKGVEWGKVSERRTALLPTRATAHQTIPPGAHTHFVHMIPTSSQGVQMRPTGRESKLQSGRLPKEQMNRFTCRADSNGAIN